MTHETRADDCDRGARCEPPVDAMATARGCPRQNVNGPYRVEPERVRAAAPPLASRPIGRPDDGGRRSANGMSAFGFALLASSSLALALSFAEVLETNRLLGAELEHAHGLLHTTRRADSPIERRSRSLGRFVTRVADDVWDVDRRLFDADRPLLESLDTTPNYTNGHMLGVRMSTNELAFLGIEAGDVVLAIDGFVLDARVMATTSSADVLGRLRAETRIEVAILRGGEPYTLTYLLA